MQKRNLWLIIGAVVVIAVIIIGIRLTRKPTPREQVIKIGAILALTGPGSMIGEWQRNGLNMAVAEINSEGGIRGAKVEIVFEDSRNDPKEGVSAFNKMITIKKYPAIFSAFSSVSSAILPLADKNKINLLMLAVSLPGIANKSKWAFRFNVGSDDEAQVMADFLVERLRLKRMAVFYINDEFGRGAYKVFKEIFEKRGGKITWAETYEKGGTDFRSVLSKLKNVGHDGVYVIGYTKASALAIKQLREVGVKTPLFANMALTVPIFLKLIGKAAEGAYFTTCLFDPNSEVPRVKKFVENYVKRFGEKPTFFSAFAYDAMKILSEAIERKGFDNEGVREGLLSIKSFPGIMGDTTILPNGDVKYPVRIVRIERGQIKEVQR